MQSPYHAEGVSYNRMVCGVLYVDVVCIVGIMVAIYSDVLAVRMVAGLIAVSVVMLSTAVCLKPGLFTCVRLPVKRHVVRFGGPVERSGGEVQRIPPAPPAPVLNPQQMMAAINQRSSTVSRARWPFALVRTDYRALSELELSEISDARLSRSVSRSVVDSKDDVDSKRSDLELSEDAPREAIRALGVLNAITRGRSRAFWPYAYVRVEDTPLSEVELSEIARVREEMDSLESVSGRESLSQSHSVDVVSEESESAERSVGSSQVGLLDERRG